MEPAGLIIRDEEQRVVPMRSIPHRLINLFHEYLAITDVPVGMHRVSVQPAARRVEVTQLRQQTKVSILEEVFYGDYIRGGVLGSPAEEECIRGEGAVSTIVVEPGNTF